MLRVGKECSVLLCLVRNSFVVFGRVFALQGLVQLCQGIVKSRIVW